MERKSYKAPFVTVSILLVLSLVFNGYLLLGSNKNPIGRFADYTGIWQNGERFLVITEEREFYFVQLPSSSIITSEKGYIDTDDKLIVTDKYQWKGTDPIGISSVYQVSYEPYAYVLGSIRKESENIIKLGEHPYVLTTEHNELVEQ